MAETTPSRARPRALAAFGVAALVLLFVVALGVTLALASRTDDGPPTELAARVPATVELFVGFDTDLASDRWVHLERLLDALGVLDRVREERDDAFAEAQIDFDLEVMPVLTEIEHAAMVVELPGGFDDEPPVRLPDRDPRRARTPRSARATAVRGRAPLGARGVRRRRPSS